MASASERLGSGCGGGLELWLHRPVELLRRSLSAVLPGSKVHHKLGHVAAGQGWLSGWTCQASASWDENCLVEGRRHGAARRQTADSRKDGFEGWQITWRGRGDSSDYTRLRMYCLTCSRATPEGSPRKSIEMLCTVAWCRARAVPSSRSRCSGRRQVCRRTWEVVGPRVDGPSDGGSREDGTSVGRWSSQQGGAESRLAGGNMANGLLEGFVPGGSDAEAPTLAPCTGRLPASAGTAGTARLHLRTQWHQAPPSAPARRS